MNAKPNQYTFVSGGLLASTHLGAEFFIRANGLKCIHVPYKGGGPAISALVGGHGDFHCGFSLVAIPLAKGGKLRILAAMGERRIKSIPDVPTLKELGINVKSGMWVGIVAPKKTPTPIVEKLRDVMTKVVKDKTYIDAIQTLGKEVRYMDGKELAKFWDKESEELTQLFKEFIKEGMKVGCERTKLL